MRQNKTAQSFNSLLTLLGILAGIVMVLSLAFNPENWLRQMRLSLPVGIHSPLYADYSADLHGMLAAPAEIRLLEEALREQHTDPTRVFEDLLTPVPTITPRPDILQPSQTAVGATATGAPTATLLPGITPTLTWTPTLTQTFEWLQPTFTPTAYGWSTSTPGATATRTSQPTATRTSQPTATRTPAPTQTSQPPTATLRPTATSTSGSYPPPATPKPTLPPTAYPTIPGYP